MYLWGNFATHVFLLYQGRDWQYENTDHVAKQKGSWAGSLKALNGIFNWKDKSYLLSILKSSLLEVDVSIAPKLPSLMKTTAGV